MFTIQFLRGTAERNDAYVGKAGAITFDTTNHALRIHDGVTAGGHAIPNEAAIRQTIENYFFLHEAGDSHDDRYYTKIEVTDLIHEGTKIHTGPEAPLDPREGTPWLDTVSMTLLTYYNGAWIQVVGQEGPAGKDGRDAPTTEEILTTAGFQYNQVGDHWFLDNGTMA